MKRRQKSILKTAGASAVLAVPAAALADSGWGPGHGAMWGMGWMGVGWILVVVLLVLGVFALFKSLGGGAGKD